MGLYVRFVCIFLFNFLTPGAPGFELLSPKLRKHTHTPGAVIPLSTPLCTGCPSRDPCVLPYYHKGLKDAYISTLPSVPSTSRRCFAPESVGHYAQRTYFCCTLCVLTVIGKDHDSLSSCWTFNEAVFMLQPQREGAEERQAGPSRRAVWGWKHFEVKDQLRGLITHLRCHSCQPPDLNEKKSKAEPGSSFPALPNSSDNIRETPLLLIARSAFSLMFSSSFGMRAAWRNLLMVLHQEFGDSLLYILDCVWRIRTCVCLLNATCRTPSNLPEHQTREKRCCWNPDPWPLTSQCICSANDSDLNLFSPFERPRQKKQTNCRPQGPLLLPSDLSLKRQIMRCNIHHQLHVLYPPVIFYTIGANMLRSEGITRKECVRLCEELSCAELTDKPAILGL